MSVNDAELVEEWAVLKPWTICNVRNAPRMLFICDAVKTCAVLKLAGKFVGVAIN